MKNDYKTANFVLLFVGLLLSSSGGCRCLGPTSTCLRPNGPILRRARHLRQGHIQRNFGRERIVSPDQYPVAGSEHYFNQHPNFRFLPVPGRDVFRAPQYAAGPGFQQHAPNYPTTGQGGNMGGQDLPPGHYNVPAGNNQLNTPVPNDGSSGPTNSRIPGRPASTQNTQRGSVPVQPNNSGMPENNPRPTDAINLDPPPGFGENPSAAHQQRMQHQPKTVVARTHNDLLRHPFSTGSKQNVSDWVHSIPVEATEESAQVPTDQSNYHQQSQESNPPPARGDHLQTNTRNSIQRPNPTSRSDGSIYLVGYQRPIDLSENRSINSFAPEVSGAAYLGYEQNTSNQSSAISQPINGNNSDLPQNHLPMTKDGIGMADAGQLSETIIQSEKKKPFGPKFKGPADPRVAFIDPANDYPQQIRVLKVEYGPRPNVEVASTPANSHADTQQQLAQSGKRVYSMFPYYPVSTNSHAMYDKVVPTLDQQGVRKIALRNQQQIQTGIVIR